MAILFWNNTNPQGIQSIYQDPGPKHVGSFCPASWETEAQRSCDSSVVTQLVKLEQKLDCEGPGPWPCRTNFKNHISWFQVGLFLSLDYLYFSAQNYTTGKMKEMFELTMSSFQRCRTRAQDSSQTQISLSQQAVIDFPLQIFSTSYSSGISGILPEVGYFIEKQ